MGSATEILNADAIHLRAQSKIDAARITQKSGNERRATEAAAQRQAQAYANSRRLDAAGEQIGAIAENTVRNLDAATAGTVSQRIAAAEELGSTYANASAAGVGGSSVDLFASTLRMNRNITEENQSRTLSSDLYASGKAKGETLVNGVDSMDNTSILPNLDYTQYVDHHKMGGFTQVLALASAGAATYFGGPQAGMAVLDAFQANNDIQNGDFEAAGQKFDHAVSRGISGWKTYTSGADNGQVGRPWAQTVYSSIFNKQGPKL